MGEILANGVRLYYEEHGTGTPILGLHGSGSTALLWGGAVPALQARGRLILYDRRGCTRSRISAPLPPTGIREQADDAIALLHGLDAAPAILVGRSYGGEIAVEMLARTPDLVLAAVLLEPTICSLLPGAEAWLAAVTERALVIAATDGPAEAAEFCFGEFLGEDGWATMPDGARDLLVDNAPALLSELAGGWSRPTAESLRHVDQPVLVVSGASSPDAFRGLDDRLTELIPGARHETVAGGHVISPSAPVVLDFLDGLLGDGIGQPPGS